MEEKSPKYRITLACSGVPAHLALQGAVDIAEEFTHRPWHENVVCAWDGLALILTADNDYDADAKALTDEFSDAISICIPEGFDGDIEVRTIEVVPD